MSNNPEIIFLDKERKVSLNPNKGVAYARIDHPKLNVAYQAGFNEAKELLNRSIAMMGLLDKKLPASVRIGMESLKQDIEALTPQGW